MLDKWTWFSFVCNFPIGHEHRFLARPESLASALKNAFYLGSK